MEMMLFDRMIFGLKFGFVGDEVSIFFYVVGFRGMN